MTIFRYCAYCDAFRERPRCEVCGHTTHTLKPPPLSELPKEWRLNRAALAEGEKE